MMTANPMRSGTVRILLYHAWRCSRDGVPLPFDIRLVGGRGLHAEEEALLRWGASLSDQELLGIRNLGVAKLRWLRANAEGHPFHERGLVEVQ